MKNESQNLNDDEQEFGEVNFQPNPATYTTENHYLRQAPATASQLIFDEARYIAQFPLSAHFANEQGAIAQRLEDLAAQVMDQEQAGSPD